VKDNFQCWSCDQCFAGISITMARTLSCYFKWILYSFCRSNKSW